MFEKLPQEIAAIILGQLSFGDLILASNVSRWFFRQCKWRIDDWHDKNKYKIPREWNPAIAESYFGRNFNNQWSDGKLCTNVDIILNFAEYSVEEYFWLYALAKNNKFYSRPLVLIRIAGRILDRKIGDSMKIFYFHKCFFYEDDRCAIDHVKMTAIILKSYNWRQENLPLFREIIMELAKDENKRKVLFQYLKDDVECDREKIELQYCHKQWRPLAISRKKSNLSSSAN